MLDLLMHLGLSPARIAMVHAGATWFMVGLIWFVQIVHYPLFQRVPEAACARYALHHQRRTTWVVGPVMLVEALSALVLIVSPPPAPSGAFLAWTGASVLGLIWLSTFFVQVPLHDYLARQFDAGACRRLVITNWVRTTLWTVRGVLALSLLGPV